MNNRADESQIAGVEYATFMGIILTVTGVIGIIALVLTGSVPAQAMGGLAGAGAVVTVIGNAMIAKGMGYRAVFSAIRGHPGLWLFATAMAAGGGAIMIGTAALLLKATS